MWFNYQNEKYLVPAYSKLAYIYDEVMAHVDYKNWSRYIVKIIQRWHPNSKKILDISCGTGSLLLKLSSKKYQIYGFDFSYDMLNVARQKFKRSKLSIPLWQGNMICFQLNQQVDVIISLYDSVNYILNKSDWKNMFDCVYDGLSDGGLFVFDICTEKNSKQYFQNYYEKKKGKSFFYTRESKYNTDDKIHSNRFVIFFDDEKKNYVELHKQKILALREVLDLIEQTSFEFLGAFHGITFRPANENSLRIHFVLKKKIAHDSPI